MTIQFTTTHFASTGLSITEYIFLLAHEDGNPTNKELETIVNCTPRAVIRLRRRLEQKGYIQKPNGHIKNIKSSLLTNKMYENK